MPTHPDEARKREQADDLADTLRAQYAHHNPPGQTADAYRIASYTDGLVGASPECDVLRPKYNSGIRFADRNNPKPDDVCFGRGVGGGIRWDGTFYRDTTRYPAGGQLFWSSYFKPGSAAGMKAGYWINFGSGWSHLHNDNPAEILTGASQKLFWDVAALSERGNTGAWKLMIQATKFVTHEVIDVWTGTKTGGNDPTGTYSRDSGLDPVATLTVEAAP